MVDRHTFIKNSLKIQFNFLPARNGDYVAGLGGQFLKASPRKYLFQLSTRQEVGRHDGDEAEHRCAHNHRNELRELMTTVTYHRSATL
jgi:hypothetical protein